MFLGVILGKYFQVDMESYQKLTHWPPNKWVAADLQQTQNEVPFWGKGK